MKFNGLFILCILFLFVNNHKTAAQKQNNVWYFGHYAGLDFNTNPPTPLKGESYTVEGNASISDAEGHLLFYTNGEKVWDRNHHVMPNGQGLMGGVSSDQAALIVPLPGSFTKYYLFTTGDDFSTPLGMRYSIIEMLLNDGYGDIISSTKNTLVLDATMEMLTAVLHSNGRDIWIITHTINSKDFFAFLLTDAGLSSTPVLSLIGSQLIYPGGPYVSIPGPVRSSHNGSKIVSAVTFGNVCEMFDFNSTTGQIMNHVDLKPFINGLEVYGIEFSSNDSLLYLAGYSELTGQPDTNIVLQINLYNNPFQSITVGYNIKGSDYGTLQIGPDKKIYLARAGNPFIDVIHNPNKPGTGCQFEESGVMLLPGTIATYGLPNPAPYSFCPVLTLGHDTSICINDTLRLDIELNSTDDCPLTYVWYDGTIDSVKLITQPGIYWIEVNNSNIVYRDSIHIDSVFHTQVTATICVGESFEGYTESGTYIDTFLTVDGCDSIRTITLTVNFTDIIEKVICSGESYEGHTETGIYIDTLPNPPNCDFLQILKLKVISCEPIVAYSLDACESIMSNGSHMDYSEFTPDYPSILPCAEVQATHLFRTFPEKHSCTPGINGSPAMCVTTRNSCQYEEGDSASVIIEFTIHPEADSIVRFTGLEFYEKSPFQYNWINGPSGPNKYPFYYGIRILKNGEVIYRRPTNFTHQIWTLQTFDFSDDNNFDVDTTTVFRIELLPYCRSGTVSTISVWDLDEIRIYGGCVFPLIDEPVIEGNVFTKSGQNIPNALIYLSIDPLFSHILKRKTNEEGYYIFDPLQRDKSYFLKGYKNDDVRNGISTLDLIRIQKHILGIDPFTTLDQYIAADINHNGKISALDMVSLMKLLLGKISEFPNNTSWRFGSMPQDFTGKDISSFQEIKSFEVLDTTNQKADFLGIKIGDLNGDVTLNDAENNIVTRGELSLSLLIQDQILLADQQITVPIVIEDDVIMEGLQLSMDINNFNLLAVQPGRLGISEENINVSSDGILRIIWTDSKGVSFKSGQALFTLVLNPKVSGTLQNLLHLANDYLLPECYSATNEDPINLKLEFNTIPVIQQEQILFQIEPNPFQSKFNLRFHLNDEENVVFRIYDVTGKLCSIIDNRYPQGENIETIDLSTYPSLEGIIYCQMISTKGTSIRKAINVR